MARNRVSPTRLAKERVKDVEERKREGGPGKLLRVRSAKREEGVTWARVEEIGVIERKRALRGETRNKFPGKHGRRREGRKHKFMKQQQGAGFKKNYRYRTGVRHV
jgi:hypothetical protein